MAITIVKQDTITIEKKTRNRALEIVGEIRSIGKVKREGATATPWPLVHTTGGTEDFRIEHTDGGHLLGLSLGGTDTSDNVVSMYCGFNRYYWRLNVEAEIDEVNLSTTEKLRVRIKIDYQIADPRLPKSFLVRVEEIKTGKVLKTFPKILHTPPVELKDDCTKKDKQTFEEMVTEVNKSKWSLDGYLAAQKQNLILPPTPGPYAVLDYMLFVKGYFPTVRVGNAGEFTAEQRRLILLVNPTIHGKAYVASDHPDDKYKKLTDFGDSGAEIDHIWPKAKAGSNAFSNAQVISSAANKGKTDK